MIKFMWKARNDKVFNGVLFSPDEVAHKALEDITELGRLLENERLQQEWGLAALILVGFSLEGLANQRSNNGEIHVWGSFR